MVEQGSVMKMYSYLELQTKTIGELEIIKSAKQDELYQVQKDKDLICGNIMSLQELIIEEKKKIK